MYPTTQFDQLHFFLDESGSFGEKDVNLVGGVIVLGPYDSAADAALMQLLQESVSKCKARFPQDLHFFQSSLTSSRRRELCKEIATRLPFWQREQRWLTGIALRHQRDIFPSGSNILAEQQHDNRYLQILCTLIEHVCFVDPYFTARLSPKAEIFVYVGQRYFRVENTQENRELLSRLGYEVVVHMSNEAPCMARSLTTHELRGLIRSIVRERWPQTQLQFQCFKVCRINYDARRQTDHPAAMYLADLELGCLRNRCRGVKDAERLLAYSRLLDYDQKLHHLVQMASALAQGSLASFLDRSRSYWALSSISVNRPSDDPLSEVQAVLEQSAAQLAQRDAAPLLVLLKDACDLVDSPGQIQKGVALADFAIRILNRAERLTPEAEILALQAHLSAANHTGETEIADFVWQEYTQREEQLLACGLSGLERMAEMRNRRAISRLDQFCFEEAKIILAHILSHVESGFYPLAKMFDIPVEKLPMRLIGTLFGTLGQVFALQTQPDHSRAEACFRRALDLFNASADQQRQWTYLGHLACDRGESGHALWQEVCHHLADLASVMPICEEGRQYQLALQIKGFYVFRPREDILAFLEQWQQNSPTQAYSEESQKCHPFGLIYQGLGLLYARLGRETRDHRYYQQALPWFDRAAELMQNGGPLLKILARIARIRQWLVKAEMQEASEAAEKRLGELLQGLRGYLAEHYGENAWYEAADGTSRGHFGQADPGPKHSWRERAQAILQAVRFNYW
ncbi:MAG: hypothetical protein RMJ19_02245 [Gemmatales bacterium]|nr:hypothetical protein [Gemmatales bacterium]MCS7159268.1 hypothetical protein [Gemmatales bacterium]MDW8174468.1 hypothetical protein [Gemmatales bacterium]MDW8222178.1 hypothetical protein [Gemmatales bacterium]